MKIKLSRLRKIINEELSGHLNEAAGDAARDEDKRKVATLEDEIKRLRAAIHAATVKKAQIRADSASDNLNTATQNAQKSAATAAVAESDTYDVDNILYEDDLQEIIRKTKEKDEWCLSSIKGDKNLGCYGSKKGAKKREKQVTYFKNIKKK